MPRAGRRLGDEAGFGAARVVSTEGCIHQKHQNSTTKHTKASKFNTHWLFVRACFGKDWILRLDAFLSVECLMFEVSSFTP
jgi:hypothetical protein